MGDAARRLHTYDPAAVILRDMGLVDEPLVMPAVAGGGR
jgi:hypothetical protein